MTIIDLIHNHENQPLIFKIYIQIHKGVTSTLKISNSHPLNSLQTPLLGAHLHLAFHIRLFTLFTMPRLEMASKFPRKTEREPTLPSKEEKPHCQNHTFHS